MTKKEIAGLCAIGGLLAPTNICAAEKTGETKPNILFILSDDHTSQAWGIYGGILAPYVRNDNIERLAREGCTLDNVFCTNSISVPSRASILTGQYSHLNGVRTLADALDPERDNIAKRMRQAGYQTAIVGKWHLKTMPSGFDWFSVLHGQGEYVDPRFKTEEDWKDFDYDYWDKHGKTEKGFSTDIITDKTIEWISNREQDKPFMMFCHFKATHEPWDFPERMRHIYDGVVFPEPENLMEFGCDDSGRTFPGQPLENLAGRWEQASKKPYPFPFYPELPFSTEGMDEKEARSHTYQKFIRDYLRCGAAIDDNIGRLLDFLDREGLAENTIVIYVSDQGYFLGEHGFFDKRIMYEEALRMPFVIRYGKEIPAGTRNDDIILNTDFASLLADYAGAETPENAQGRSFRSNLTGSTAADWRTKMYYRYWTHHEIRPAHMGIRDRRYKLIFFYGDRLGMADSSDRVSVPSWEFYDLAADPHENHNRYSDPAYADIIEEMKNEMLRLRDDVGDTDEGSERMQQIMSGYYW